MHIWAKTIFCKQYIDQTRDILDAELTGLVGESYNRAYGVMVNTQLLSEMEEICRCLASPERKPQLKKIWWKRLLVCLCIRIVDFPSICSFVHVSPLIQCSNGNGIGIESSPKLPLYF